MAKLATTSLHQLKDCLFLASLLDSFVLPLVERNFGIVYKRVCDPSSAVRAVHDHFPEAEMS